MHEDGDARHGAKPAHDVKTEPHAARAAHADAGKPADAHGHGGGGPGPGPGKWIGVTMAVLGVMLAVCAAFVGSERTELLAMTIEQANKIGIQQAEATKFRVMDSDRELLHAVTPSKAEVGKFEAALKNVRSKSGKADDEATAEIKDLLDTATRSVADVLSPDPEDEARIDSLRLRYQHDLAEAKEDAEAYDGAIEAHGAAAEGYERAQLCAEVGIVVASIALLLANRAVWGIALIIGTAGLGIAVKTRIETSSTLAVAERKIEEVKTNTAAIEDEGARSEPDGPDRPTSNPSSKPASKQTPQPE